MFLLGTCLSLGFDASLLAFQHRLDLARSAFFARKDQWKNQFVSLTQRFQCYSRDVQTVLLHGCEFSGFKSMALEWPVPEPNVCWGC